MATKRQVVKRCEELGVVMDDLSFDCPLGTCIAGSGLHWFEKDSLLGSIPKYEIWDDVLDELSWGLEDCPDSCEYCQDQLDSLGVVFEPAGLSIREQAMIGADQLELKGDPRAKMIREQLK